MTALARQSRADATYPAALALLRQCLLFGSPGLGGMWALLRAKLFGRALRIMRCGIFIFPETTVSRSGLVAAFSKIETYTANNSCTILALLGNCTVFDGLFGSVCCSQSACSLDIYILA